MKFPSKLVPFLIITGIFLALQVASIVSLPYAQRMVDTDKYLRMAEKPLISKRFLAGERPWGVPLFYKLLGVNTKTADIKNTIDYITDDPKANIVHIAQSVIHIFCWSLLAFFTGRIFRSRWLSIVAIISVYLIALSTPVLMWNRVIMSESLTLSVTAAVLAMFLWIADRPRHFLPYFLLAPTLFYWVNLRDTNILTALVIAVVVLFAGLVFRNLYPIILAVALIGIVFLSNYTFNISQRWTLPMVNIVFQRVLGDPPALNYFAKQGMPVNQALMDMEGELSCSHNCAINNTDALRSYWQWHIKNIRSVYIKYLLHNFFGSITDPIRYVDEIHSDFLTTPDIPGYFSPSPDWLSNLLYAAGSSVQILLALAIAVFLSLTHFWKQRPGLAVFIFLMILGYFQTFLIFNGDTAEITRHALSVNVEVTLTFWILLLGCVEWFFDYKVKKSIR